MIFVLKSAFFQNPKFNDLMNMSAIKQGAGFDKWFTDIENKRVRNCGASVADFKFASCRIRRVKGKNQFADVSKIDIDSPSLKSNSGSVVYWMNRDQRVQDNWALLFAQRVAMKFSVPLHVCFNLQSSSATKTSRHLTFLLQGLTEVDQECRDLGIGFHLLPISTIDNVAGGAIKRRHDGDVITSSAPIQQSPVNDLLKTLGASVLITDFSPLREDAHTVQCVAQHLSPDVPFYQVDAHNTVPAWFASPKLEYAARTIRKKLHEKSAQLLTDFPPVVRHPVSTSGLKPIDWSAVRISLRGRVDETVEALSWAHGGTSAAFRQLHFFLCGTLKDYAAARNDPTKKGLSNLSPWFHFGHISPQRCIYEANLLRARSKDSVDAFIEEAFIRRELSDNFCFYNPHYDCFTGAWSWAQETLRIHSDDARKPAYTEDQMNSAETGDELWNAAQRQLVREGKLHGFLRMYWAKKILEWHAGGPQKALKFAIWLNDHYAIDGSDPNGYVGVMWSICGIHDQGWAERPIFGKIRYMNYTGCKRKFDVDAFIKRYPKSPIRGKPA